MTILVLSQNRWNGPRGRQVQGYTQLNFAPRGHRVLRDPDRGVVEAAGGRSKETTRLLHPFRFTIRRRGPYVAQATVETGFHGPFTGKAPLTLIRADLVRSKEICQTDPITC
jgi:hypothetical protein